MDSPVKLSIIAARSENGVIGVGNKLPWHLADDLKFFKQATKGHPIIMGRRTWESLPIRPLPGRDNIVLTEDWSYQTEGARVFSALRPAMFAAKSLARAAGKQEVFVIGGRSLYGKVLADADLIYLTEVAVTLEGDTYFPDIDESLFEEISSLPFKAGAGNDHDFTIRVLKRKKPA